VVVALTGGPEGPMLLRRGARIAGRVAGRSLVAVHVVRSDGTVGSSAPEIEKQRMLAENLGGSLQLVVGDDVAATVLEFARTVNGTQIVVGASRHGRFAQLVRPSTANAIVRGSGDIDVYVVTHQKAARASARFAAPRIIRRGPWPWLAAVLIPSMLAVALLPLRAELALSTVLLIFLLGVLANALIGGVVPAALAALIAGSLANLLFTRPYGSLTISQPENAFALVVFVVVGVTVASVVDRSAVRAAGAARGRAEAQLVAAAATSVVDAADPVRAVLEQARVGFGMTSVVLLSISDGGSARPVRTAGVDIPTAADGSANPDAADVAVAAGSGWMLALYGRPLTPADRALVDVFAAQAVLAIERERLTREAEQGERLRQADRVRTAVLAALSHDLRTPLATIKASVSSLRDRSIAWSEDDQAELLAATDEAADQLDGLLANLLDLSRLQTGVLVPLRHPVSVDEVVHRALIGIPVGRIRDSIPDDLPLIDTDAGLLERVIANITANAVRHTPADAAVRLLAGEISDDQGRRVQIRIADSGPGVPEDDREAMFAPFQRLGDVPQGSGVGLGLAVARGLAEAVDATIEVEDTPGGGLTMIVTVPVAVPVVADAAVVPAGEAR
jgi:two-component system sensor histidine kinase KdpD